MSKDRSKISFLVLLLILLSIFAVIVKPFLVPFIISLVVVIVCQPLNNFFLKLTKGKNYISSFLSTIAAILLILVPIGIVVNVVITNAAEAITSIMSTLEQGTVANFIDRLNSWINLKQAELDVSIFADINIRTSLINFLGDLGKLIYSYSPKVVTFTAGILVNIIMTIIFTFVLFAEGGRLYKSIFDLLPLEENHKNILAGEVKKVVSATFLGMMLTSIAQGVLIGIGFAIVGIDKPIFWGLVAMGVTLIPVVGGPLMYVPASFAFLANAEMAKGIFLLLYGIFIVSIVDNVIKPLVLKGKVDVHPVILAMSLIGGAILMGPKGILIGPLVTVLMLAMLKIYKSEFI